ncbi:bifunctional histidinol-phosphatase/imidazoleglycerol-phosphate dehydratase HisB [Pantoea sp. Aalb]|uniref:bifunctional histidinol-phosphatase/imidazoleglycerol-phosphate dehydratase HisB n=1 Tax=Pantoea sp. Aalb TaxID=2576762 RepID=UPI001326ADE2|nr:bifunctional histidinol-phosphatase/imidazoleglycerol-phosphate dehydratase HisB [Pantoea sp. Aalb]MXP67336.1 bifunctional histidinol-phosphatase/imidazoleglycerol-phosphate dehydratase HisB [Pantoea sp. Aalb]
MSQKILFIDRDGTLISEPVNTFQVDHIDKLRFEKNVLIALLALKNSGYQFVMITNQDGLGTDSFSQDNFNGPHNLIIDTFISQGIYFNEILICPHTLADHCKCRKPQTKMVDHWLKQGVLDIANSYVIGDRVTDIELAKNMGIQGIRYGREGKDWNTIQSLLTKSNRYALVNRNTKETQIKIEVWLDQEGNSQINTGLRFFDHMLEQLAIHGGFSIKIDVSSDLYVDDHHTIEDVGLVLGQTLLKALGDKCGISRFGFVLPMDESMSTCVLDISGRPYFKYKAKFNYQYLGDISTEMIEHFFRSLSYSMMVTLHLKTQGDNDHHMVESLFKAFGRTLRQAMNIKGNIVPSSKGVL